MLSAFRRAHPDVELTVAEYEPPGGVTAVATGEVAVALTHAYEPAGPAAAPPGVVVEALLVEESVLVTAPGHVLADGSGRLPVRGPGGPAADQQCAVASAAQWGGARLASAGATPAVVCESPGCALVCALVSAGPGVAVVPEMVAAMAATPLRVRQLEPASFRRTISVVHRGGESGPAVRSLRALMRGAFARAGSRARSVPEAGTP